MDNIVQIIGLISASLTSIAFMPQVIKTWRTRSTKDLSPLMFTLFFIGVIGWLIYGLMSHDIPIIIANIITVCLSGILLFFLIRGDNTRTVSHVGIYVDDLELMKEFYCSAFGAKSSSIYNNSEKKFSSCFITFSGGASIELMHVDLREGAQKTQEWGHVAISTGSKEKVDALTDKLAKEGLTILSGPRITGDGFYESLIRDPEGNSLEITV